MRYFTYVNPRLRSVYYRLDSSLNGYSAMTVGERGWRSGIGVLWVPRELYLLPKYKPVSNLEFTLLLAEYA